MLAILLLSACFDAGPDADTGSGTVGTGSPTWGSYYGSCETADTTTLVVSAEQLGEPLAILVEFETSAWIQVGFEPDPTMPSFALVSRNDEGIWLMCPAGASQWHVSWASAPG